jgi:hypothetical protein
LSLLEVSSHLMSVSLRSWVPEGNTLPGLVHCEFRFLHLEHLAWEHDSVIIATSFQLGNMSPIHLVPVEQERLDEVY